MIKKKKKRKINGDRERRIVCGRTISKRKLRNYVISKIYVAEKYAHRGREGSSVHTDATRTRLVLGDAA